MSWTVLPVLGWRDGNLIEHGVDITECAPVNFEEIEMGFIGSRRLDTQPFTKSHGRQAADALFTKIGCLRIATLECRLDFSFPRSGSDHEEVALQIIARHARSGVRHSDPVETLLGLCQIIEEAFPTGGSFNRFSEAP